jgi:adenylylsulfate reductase subunit A
MEKANLIRSGCLAAGVNALNAWLAPGKTPKDYADYALWDSEGIASRELLLSMSSRLNEAAEFLDSLGLKILKGPNGEWKSRSWRNLMISGENIKPLLAGSLKDRKNLVVLERTQALCYLLSEDEGKGREMGNERGNEKGNERGNEKGNEKGNERGNERGRDEGKGKGKEIEIEVNDERRIAGAVGLRLDDLSLVIVEAKAVICATGGAAGIYAPNNRGISSHKMWYPPFDTGAGYAMGILAGAELTTLEMRFVALRAEDTCAPTGSLAVGARAIQTNSLGEAYEEKYGNKTNLRVLAARRETEEGRGPVSLETPPLGPKERAGLFRAYFNMAPLQSLKWLEEESPGSLESREERELSVFVEGSEPYVIGGHTASGYFIKNDRETTIKGLFAAGDAAGGAPQKYVSGAMAEGWIASEGVLRSLKEWERKFGGEREEEDKGKSLEEKGALRDSSKTPPRADLSVAERLNGLLSSFLINPYPGYDAEALEEAMQKAMDHYAGGKSRGYKYNDAGLKLAEERILNIFSLSGKLRAENQRDLLRIWELRERLIVARSLIRHLSARKETRWPGFGEYAEHPGVKDEYLLFINSRISSPDPIPPLSESWGEIEIVKRDLEDGKIVPEGREGTEGTEGDAYEKS